MWKRNRLEDYQDTWGWYRFFPHSDELIHPADRALFSEITTAAALSRGFLCSVFACTGTEKDFLRLHWKHYEIRARTDNYSIVPSPNLYWGDTVRIKRKPDRVRRVLEIWFHHKRNQIVYHIESTDPNGTTYWFYDELEVISATRK